MSGHKRITKELADLTNSPIPGITVTLPNDNDIHVWHILMHGPEKSPFVGGKFHLTLALPPDYPFKPPTLSFTTKIYHPNVTNDDKGSMCLGLLRAEQWKPSSKVDDVLRFAMQLLSEPMPEDAVEASIAGEYKNDRKGWEKKAKEWTKRYAVGIADGAKK